jgi:hypothetical protein
VNIYKSFNGDIDGWIRIGTPEQRAGMRDKDWLLIDGFLQDIRLVKKGLASDVYMKSIDERLQEICDSEETIKDLKVGAYSQNNHQFTTYFLQEICRFALVLT